MTVAPAVDAATVMLLRGAGSGPSGIEVVLLHRHRRSPAFAGAHVFPGGKVGPSDRELDTACWTVGDLSAQRAQLHAGSDEEALGFLVAAVRESFEEAGVLLASRRDGTPVTSADLGSKSFIEARQRLNSRSEPWSWTSWLRRQGLVLDLDALVYWSWWITPVDRPYRFDTRFFAAALPEGQKAQNDGFETTDMRWVTPHRALDDHDAGLIQLREATVRSLESVACFDNVQEALASGAEPGDVDHVNERGEHRGPPPTFHA